VQETGADTSPPPVAWRPYTPGQCALARWGERKLEKSKEYNLTRFPAEEIEQACATLLSLEDGLRGSYFRTISKPGGEGWKFDSNEEFFAEYRNGFSQVHFSLSVLDAAPLPAVKGVLRVMANAQDTTITVSAATRVLVERVSAIFDRAAPTSRVPRPVTAMPPPPAPVVFIGHGHSPQWRNLKDHLHDHHGYDVEAYEVGARAGHVVRDVLQQMLDRSSFALLVLTGEDEMATGALRPRENVVHEAGLFQGRLGFQRAIVLVEEGVEPFSNLQGINQIRYSRGNIRETYGDVLATLRREFKRE
jgi:predicted nucleotide-binding protein